MPDVATMPDASHTWEARGGWVLNALMVEFSLTREQAAGPVGNIGFESTGLTELHERGQPEGVGGYGWAQWTAGRRTKFLAWCKTQKLDWHSDAANYGYLVLELHGDYAYCINAVRKETTVERSVFVFGRLYEAPGGTTPSFLPGYDRRLAYARRALVGSVPPAPISSAIPTIVDLQRALIEAGLSVGPDGADGKFGPATIAALSEYYRHYS